KKPERINNCRIRHWNRFSWKRQGLMLMEGHVIVQVFISFFSKGQANKTLFRSVTEVDTQCRTDTIGRGHSQVIKAYRSGVDIRKSRRSIPQLLQKRKHLFGLNGSVGQ